MPTINNLKEIDYEQLIFLVKENKITCIIGRYYAPVFDIEQLHNSNEVHQYIWGETTKPSVFVCKVNNLTVYAIMTQYLRVYTDNPLYEMEDFELLLEYILHKTVSLGFEEIYIQVYTDLTLTNILKKLGSIIDGENYPIFNL